MCGLDVMFLCVIAPLFIVSTMLQNLSVDLLISLVIPPRAALHSISFSLCPDEAKTFDSAGIWIRGSCIHSAVYYTSVVTNCNNGECPHKWMHIFHSFQMHSAKLLFLFSVVFVTMEEVSSFNLLFASTSISWILVQHFYYYLQLAQFVYALSFFCLFSILLLDHRTFYLHPMFPMILMILPLYLNFFYFTEHNERYIFV